MVSTYGRIKKLYDKLQDEESRRVFSLSVQKSIPGCSAKVYDALLDEFDFTNPLWKVFVQKYCHEFQRLKDAQQDGQKIIFYPAGSGMYPDARRLFERFGITVDYASDKNTALWGKNVYGSEVIPPEKMFQIGNKTVVLVSANGAVRKWLAQNGISGEILCNLPLEYALYAMSFGSLYFSAEFLPPPGGEGHDCPVYVDCGVYDGEDIKGYAEYVKMQYKKIIGFEPDRQAVKTLSENLKDWDLRNVSIIQKAVGERDEVLKFTDFGGMGGTISANGTVEIEATSIDNVLGGGRADFIKMDIEGSELPALRGAEKTILKYKPILAVSVYHKREDIFAIPEYILSLVPEYRLYLRNYSLSANDNVLYAIV